MMLTIRDDMGAVASLMMNVFFNVWVESVKPYGPDTMLTKGDAANAFSTDSPNELKNGNGTRNH